MSSGGAPDREEREEQRARSFLQAAERLHRPAQEWLRYLDGRAEPPTAAEWALRRALLAVEEHRR